MNAADGFAAVQRSVSENTVDAAELQTLCITPNEFVLPGFGPAARTGVLLVHGLTGTPAEMRVLGKGLNRQGFTVYSVQLAGHCGEMADLVDTRWGDWLASVESGLDRFADHVDQVVVSGLSMGALLSLAIAEKRPEKVAGVCALSTTFRYDGWSIPSYTKLAFLLPLFRSLGIGRKSVFMEAPCTAVTARRLACRAILGGRSSSCADCPLMCSRIWPNCVRRFWRFMRTKTIFQQCRTRSIFSAARSTPRSTWCCSTTVIT